MIQTLNTLSLVFAILAVVMVIVSVMIFFNWKIREVRGYLTGKTKADVLANLREETDSQKRYAMNTEMFTSQMSVSTVQESTPEAKPKETSLPQKNIEAETAQFTSVVVGDESEVNEAEFSVEEVNAKTEPKETETQVQKEEELGTGVEQEIETDVEADLGKVKKKGSAFDSETSFIAGEGNDEK